MSLLKEDAFTPVDSSSISKDSNIIGSQTVYRRKDHDTMKATIVPWCHRDEDRDKLRSDFPCANLEKFRLVVSVASENSWELGQMDISTAFLNASGFDRDIFVRPPKEVGNITGVWTSNTDAYGLVDSGRLW